MLLVGRQTARTCTGIDRRAFLQVGASSVLGLSLADLLRACRRRGRDQRAGEGGHPAVAVGRAEPARHLRPQAERARSTTAGRSAPSPRGSPASGSANCSRNSPKLTDKLAVIRTLHTQSNDHGIAGTIGLTGSGAGGTGLDGKPLPGSPRPALGSVVAKALGEPGAQARRDVRHPPVLRHRRQAAPGEEGDHRRGRRAARGRVGSRSASSTTPPPARRSPRCSFPKELTPERLADRQQLLDAFGQAESRDRRARAPRQARRLPRAGRSPCSRRRPRRPAFDLSKEKPRDRRPLRPHAVRPVVPARPAAGRGRRAVRAGELERPRRGRGGRGRRRLGPPLPQLPDHAGPPRAVARPVDVRAAHRPRTTAACSTSTLVIAVGEFGREPKVNDKAGREHWPGCYSALARRRRGEGRARHRHERREGRQAGRHAADAGRPERDRPATQIGLTSEQITGLGLTPTGRVIEELF